MKFEIEYIENFWQVGFYKNGFWVCLTAWLTKNEAEAELQKITGSP